MGRNREGWTTIGRDDDGQSSVLGVVLMMGFVAAAAVSVFVIGTATVGETRDTAQEQQVENTFKQFNKDVASVAYGRQKYRSMQFDIEDQTAAFRQKDTGTIRVEVDGEEKVNRSVGALVYENNGETIAYQAGGVWRGTGKDSRMISRPPVEYQNGSLTFPIMVLDGDDQVQAGELDLNKKTTDSVDSLGFVKGKLVTLYITSEYYMGWAEYFRTQTNDVSVSVDHSPAGDKGTVKVKLGKPIANGDFQNGVLATGGEDGDILLDSGSAEISNGPVAATGDIDDNTDGIPDDQENPNQESDLYELDEAIDRKVEETKTNATDPDEPEETVNLESGGDLNSGKTYYADGGFTLDDETIDVDLGSGNVTLVINGSMTLKDHGDIDVDPEGTDNAFRIYTTGDLSLDQSEFGAEWDEGAKYTQIYGTSEMLVAITGGNEAEFVGTIYAPRNEPVLENGQPNSASQLSNEKCKGWDACVTTGSANVKGAIVAGPTKFAQSAGLTYDTDLETIQPTMELDDGVLPPPITFLKVSVHTVAVNNSGSNNVRPAGGFGASASVTALATPSTPSTTGFASVTGSSGAVVAPAARTAPLR